MPTTIIKSLTAAIHTPQALDAWMRKEIARWRKIAAAANLEAD
jgi:hypothetical protein